MKRLLFLGIVLLLAGCDKEKNSKLDPSAMISIRAAQPGRASAEGHLTALEIVDQTNDMCFTNKRFYPDSEQLSRGFSDAQKDYVNERLLMWGSDIINPETGEIYNSFIYAEDMVLQRVVDLDKDIVDTIAYLSNSTLRSAEAAILEAYAREDYTAVYKLFDEAFTFAPITGAEWRELKRQGIN